ncbi:L-fuconate dehydratase [Aeoliella mucimassa]|uniref:L-fuconate dehydratase n=1 Tax=Aeoliella mucimassa TaxID=2527972 RepID=A0A518AQH1_9BACT|nr:L-fuconate dehydratase [Aeoliella mucimassa]QDU56970.1 L-fuconate dehydratase [Aeoliella mucimassa]
MDPTLTITDCKVVDLRFPTSEEAHGSDAMHSDPDYSAAYVVLTTNQSDLTGFGLTFTLGRGTDLCVGAIEQLAEKIVGKQLSTLVESFSETVHQLANDSQLRWLGPEKGVVHLATAALLNAVWDLWARAEGKPLWKLVCDLTPEELLRCINFSYLSNALTKEQALEILQANEATKAVREAELLETGFPAYTTSAGWLGYSDDLIRRLCREALADGWEHFKLKVGANLEDDRRRAAIIREVIGPDRKLMVDANQRWEVAEAIEWVKSLAEFNLWWVEEPTSPDDAVGHAEIARAIAPIGVATGEQCQNRVMFKQLLQLNAISFCQIDSCRIGSVNEILGVLLMAKRFGVPVCPHAGGVGLCEYVNHLVMIDYIAVGASLENRVAEFVDHLHEHFVYPVEVKRGHYMPPQAPGYSAEIHTASLDDYRYPDGVEWQKRLSK